MSKGSNRRPCQIPRDQEEAAWDRVFGPKKLNVMSNEDREQLNKEETFLDRDREVGGDVLADGHDGGGFHAEGQDHTPFWIGPGYRGEYTCSHGIGHGNYIHRCCEQQCCQRPDFPLKGIPSDES